MSRSINPISSFKPGTEPLSVRPRAHRLDESATSYSLTGCSPALPVSASPADLYIPAVNEICQPQLKQAQRNRNFQLDFSAATRQTINIQGGPN